MGLSLRDFKKQKKGGGLEEGLHRQRVQDKKYIYFVFHGEQVLFREILEENAWEDKVG